MIVVADASVAIKWFLPEEGSDDAARLLASDAEFPAPELLRLDLAGLLQRREMRGEIAAGLARGIARELDRMIARCTPAPNFWGLHMPKPWRAATRSPISSISNCRSGSGRRSSPPTAPSSYACPGPASRHWRIGQWCSDFLPPGGYSGRPAFMSFPGSAVIPRTPVVGPVLRDAELWPLP